MKRYRIVQDGNHFKIQRRWFLFWVDMTRDGLLTAWFSSQEEAELALDKFVNLPPKRVVKEIVTDK